MAGDGLHVEVRGYAELAAGTRMLAHNIEEAAGREFLGVADQAAGRTRGRLPRRTGRTASSVRADQREGGALVRMGDGVPYAQYEEYGGRGFPHSPTGNYLYPSAMSVEPVLIVTGARVAIEQIGATHWPSP